MYGNNMHGDGYAPPYGYNGYRPSGGRMWGMSHSLPSGMDNEFTSSYPASSTMSARRIYNDFSGGGGGGSSGGMGSMGNMAPAASTNSLNCSAGGAGSGNEGHEGGVGGVNGTNLIVNYLPQDMTDRELYALFRTVGPINTCRIMRDFKTGYSFGYAFVDYTSEADSKRAIESLNGITVRNKRLKVSYARPGGESIKDTNLYVTNLPRTITDDQLETIFGKYGSIVQKNILRDKLTGKPRGVAFVRYNKREEAQEAISALNNVIPEGGSQPLTVRLAEEHGKAKAQHFMAQMGLGGGPSGPPMPAMNAAYNNMVHRDRSPFDMRREPEVPYYPERNILKTQDNNLRPRISYVDDFRRFEPIYGHIVRSPPIPRAYNDPDSESIEIREPTDTDRFSLLDMGCNFDVGDDNDSFDSLCA